MKCPNCNDCSIFSTYVTVGGTCNIEVSSPTDYDYCGDSTDFNYETTTLDTLSDGTALLRCTNCNHQFQHSFDPPKPVILAITIAVTDADHAERIIDDIHHIFSTQPGGAIFHEIREPTPLEEEAAQEVFPSQEEDEDS